MKFIQDVKPRLNVGRTNAQLSDPGITYNESGITYNEIGLTYGGAYGNDIYPVIAGVKDRKPTLSVGRTNANLYDQGYTYNEAGLTYNQIGVAYGGIYENDIYPILSRALSVYPRIVLVGDFQGTPAGTAAVGGGMLIGILGLTYAAGTI